MTVPDPRILGNKNADISGYPGKDSEEEGYGNPGRCGSGNRVEADLGQQGPVGEFHHRHGGIAHDQRDADPDHFPIWRFFGIFQSFVINSC